MYEKYFQKRQYEKHFKSKLSDADSENSETQLWLDFALACEYISNERKIELQNKSKEIGKLINYMMNNPEKFK
ncbi:MAG: four helix bundle protein [Algibacter sp.]